MPNDTKTLLSLTGSAVKDLVPVRLAATETISALFRFEVDAVAPGTIDPVTVLNQPACVHVNHGNTPTRHFHGIVSEFGPTGEAAPEGRHYRLVLVPQLAATGLQIDCRLFFKKTAQDILQTLFHDAGVTDVTFRLYDQPAQRDATAQYNETSLHFATRLMEEEGWFYFFEHTQDKHTLVVTSGNNGFQAIPGAALRFGPGTTSDMLTGWRTPNVLTHGKISLRDYDPDAPSKQLKADKATVLKHGGTGTREVFRWPALTRETAGVADRAKLQMEAAEAAVSLVHAEGTMASLVAGGRFTLQDATGAPTAYVVQQISHVAQDDAPRAGTGSAQYSNSFSAFPNTVPWRQKMTTARPRMEGLHSAIVLGPSGDDIYTDDQGRIKIRFFWDWRADATADNSAWVRVVQPWAGNNWGGQFIPRVGTEVAIAFMDADPDRPVVVGGLYNGNDTPIFPKAEKTKSGFRTRSVTKGGTDAFNELSFNDDKGKELMFLHAQKDLSTEVEHDQTLAVDNDRTVTVKGKETVTITGDRTHEVSEGNDSLVVKQGNLSTDVKLGNISVKADVGAITLEALQSITLKVGQSSLTLTQTGVEMKGMMVTIEGQIQTEVKGLMVTTQGSVMLTLKGAITMIN